MRRRPRRRCASIAANLVQRRRGPEPTGRPARPGRALIPAARGVPPISGSATSGSWTSRCAAPSTCCWPANLARHRLHAEGAAAGTTMAERARGPPSAPPRCRASRAGKRCDVWLTRSVADHRVIRQTVQVDVGATGRAAGQVSFVVRGFEVPRFHSTTVTAAGPHGRPAALTRDPGLQASTWNPSPDEHPTFARTARAAAPIAHSPPSKAARCRRTVVCTPNCPGTAGSARRLSRAGRTPQRDHARACPASPAKSMPSTPPMPAPLPGNIQRRPAGRHRGRPSRRR